MSPYVSVQVQYVRYEYHITGHDPHGHNPVNYQLSAIGVNTDTINQLINISNRTRSTRLQSRELSKSLHLARSCLLCRPDNSDWSMSQTGHDPRSFNLANYQRHYHWARSRFYVNRTIAIFWSMPILKARSQFVCFNETKLVYTVIKAKFWFVFIFKVYSLQVKLIDVITIPTLSSISHVTYYSPVRHSRNLRYTSYHMIKLTMINIHLELSSNE